MYTNQAKQHQLFYFKDSLETVNRWWWHFSSVFWSHGFGYSKVSETIFVFFFRFRGLVYKAVPSVSNQGTCWELLGQRDQARVLFLVCVPKSLLRRPQGQRFLGCSHRRQSCLLISVMDWPLTTLHEEQHGFQKENCYAQLTPVCTKRTGSSSMEESKMKKIQALPSGGLQFRWEGLDK